MQPIWLHCEYELMRPIFFIWSPPNDVFQFTIFFWKYFTDYEFECTLPCCLRESWILHFDRYLQKNHQQYFAREDNVVFELQAYHFRFFFYMSFYIKTNVFVSIRFLIIHWPWPLTQTIKQIHVWRLFVLLG